MERKSGIYAILSPSGKAYFGSSGNLDKRRYEHFRLLKKGTHHCVALQNAWNKYGAGLQFKTIELCDAEQLMEREQWWIDNAGSFYKGIYNSSLSADRIIVPPEMIARRADTQRGRKYSEQTIERMREGQKRRFATLGVSDETRKKLSTPRGPHSPERIEKLRYKKSDEHKAKLSAAHKGKPERKRTAEEIEAMRIRLKEEWASGKRSLSFEERSAAALKGKVRQHMARLNWIVGGIFAPIDVGTV